MNVKGGIEVLQLSSLFTGQLLNFDLGHFIWSDLDILCFSTRKGGLPFSISADKRTQCFWEWCAHVGVLQAPHLSGRHPAAAGEGEAAGLHGGSLSFLPAGRAPTPLLEWPNSRGWGVPGITEC